MDFFKASLAYIVRLLFLWAVTIFFAFVFGFGAAELFHSDTAGIVAISIVGIFSLYALYRYSAEYWRAINR